MRRTEILERIQRYGGVTVAELARDYGLSNMTAHRDLERLAKEGLIERVRGGARAIDQRRPPHPTAWAHRVERERVAKATIAGHAAELVTDGSTIFLDASSTALALARRLMENPPDELTLVTNSPAIAYEILADPVHIVVCPGELDQHTRAIAGRWTVEFMRNVNFDLAFISAAGITLEAGLTTSRRLLADVLNTACDVATQTIGLIDATKFGRTSLVSITPAQNLHLIITDSQLSDALVDEYRRHDVALQVATTSAGD